MPNGGYPSAEEWERAEAPLKEIDPVLLRVASETGFVYTKNEREDHDRMLSDFDPRTAHKIERYVSGDAVDRIFRKVEVHPTEMGGGITVSATAWYDDAQFMRHWRFEDTATFDAGNLDQEAVYAALQDAHRRVQSWQSALDFDRHNALPDSTRRVIEEILSEKRI